MIFKGFVCMSVRFPCRDLCLWEPDEASESPDLQLQVVVCHSMPVQGTEPGPLEERQKFNH